MFFVVVRYGGSGFRKFTLSYVLEVRASRLARGDFHDLWTIGQSNIGAHSFKLLTFHVVTFVCSDTSCSMISIEISCVKRSLGWEFQLYVDTDLNAPDCPRSGCHKYISACPVPRFCMSYTGVATNVACDCITIPVKKDRGVPGGEDTNCASCRFQGHDVNQF